MSDAGHPIWATIRLAVVGTILVAMLNFNYNGWDARDYGTLLAVLTGSGGVELLRGVTRPKKLLSEELRE